MLTYYYIDGKTIIKEKPTLANGRKNRYNNIESLFRGIVQNVVHQEAQAYFENSIMDNTGVLCEQTEGENNMARLKANVNGKWITADNPQKLVDSALKKQDHGKGGITLKEYAQSYMGLYKENGSITKNTLIGYHGYLNNHIFPELGDYPLACMTADTLQTYINRKAETYTAKTIKEHINLLSQIFDSAQDDRLIERNPCKSKKLVIHGKESLIVEAHTEKEYGEFITEVLPILQGCDQLFAALSCYTGMRRGEICALRWEDIDFENKRIPVTKAVIWPKKNRGEIKNTTKNGKNRYLVIIPQLYVFLQLHRKESGYLIHNKRLNEDDAPLSNEGLKRLYQRIEKAVKEKNINFDCSRFNNRQRHNVATLMNNAEIDAKTVENQIGHHSIDFTQNRYMSAQAKQMEISMEKLSEYIAKIAPSGI